MGRTPPRPRRGRDHQRRRPQLRVVTGVATESVEHTLTDAHIPGTTADPFEGGDDVEGPFGFPSGSESDGD